MTQTQVAYWNYKEGQRHAKADEEEQKRSHLAVEAETARHYLTTERETNRANLANEDLKRQQNVETHRSAVANEAIQRERNAETARSDKANEDIKRSQNAETALHNRESESIEKGRNVETSLHNRSVESETERHNKATEWKTVTDLLGSLFKGTGSGIVNTVMKFIGGKLGTVLNPKQQQDLQQVIVNNNYTPVKETPANSADYEPDNPTLAEKIADKLMEYNVPAQFVKRAIDDFLGINNKTGGKRK